jgi:hypothetical protein
MFVVNSQKEELKVKSSKKESFVMEGKRKRKAVETVCNSCNKEFLMQERFFIKNKKHFCSPECSSNARRKTFELTCSFCDKKFERNPSDLKNSRSGHYFCSRECKEEASKVYNNRGVQIAEIQPNHYGTGNNYKKIAFSVKERKCERCGFNKNEAALVVHHRDRNRKNNSVENLEVLCANCHYVEHYKDHTYK